MVLQVNSAGHMIRQCPRPRNVTENVQENLKGNSIDLKEYFLRYSCSLTPTSTPDRESSDSYLELKAE